MVAKRRPTPREQWPATPAGGTQHVAPADSTHAGIESPAMLLQAQLGAAMASPWNEVLVEPDADRWPGAARLAVLFGGAAASWTLVWQAVHHLT